MRSTAQQLNTLFQGVYTGKKVLVTGHTGFKGSWLTLWLTELGADVVGVALPPETTPNHWDLLGLDIPDYRLDIRDYHVLADVVKNTQPEIVFHLAAQPLVRRSYRNPLETWSTNVMGTVNILEACRNNQSVRSIVLVTSDKCYENRECKRGYRETDRLGGHDPYSASKAASEIAAAGYRRAFFDESCAPLLATARAGNVIGGGDWSEDRLIPDMVRAIASCRELEIRSPHATRPWQHVLESLYGYLLLGQKLLEGRREFAESWNFGPDQQDNCTVEGMLARLKSHWPEISWRVTQNLQPHEATLLYLDSTKARTRLGWHSVWTLDEAVAATAEWYRAYMSDGVAISRSQLVAFSAQAHASTEEQYANGNYPDSLARGDDRRNRCVFRPAR